VSISVRFFSLPAETIALLAVRRSEEEKEKKTKKKKKKPENRK